MSAQRKQKLSRTRQILSQMLKENTGRAMCDSGGTPQYDEKGKYIGSTQGYGRAYERNQGVNFENQKRAWLDLTDLHCNDGRHLLEWSPTFSTYHWLASRLEYDWRLQGQFSRFAKRGENANRYDMQNMQDFPLYLREKGKHVTGLYGDEQSSFGVTYSYNDENCLSQDIQFVYFEIDDESFVLLQTHNGADARGGLTSPKAFRLTEEGSCMWDYARVELVGNRPESEQQADDAQYKIPGYEEKRADSIVWESENGGYRWDLADHDGWKSRMKLEEYPRTNDLSKIGKGEVVIDKEGHTLYCPITGWPLVPTFYP